MQQSGSSFFLLVFAVLAFVVFKAGAQADYPFRDPKPSDDARIANLVGRLSLSQQQTGEGHFQPAFSDKQVFFLG